MKTRFYQKIVALVLTFAMMFSNGVPVFAEAGEAEYPTATSNKDDVVTIEKSAAWNGETAQAADYKATVTLKASGIQTVVDYLPATRAADISLVMDKSGSTADCLIHDSSFSLAQAQYLKDDNKAKALAAIAASEQHKVEDMDSWIVHVPELSSSERAIYLTPIKTTATNSSVDGWGIFGVKPDGTTDYVSDLMNTPFYAGRLGAPYFVSHFVMDGTTPVRHVVFAHGTDLYLSEPIGNSGWVLTGSDPLDANVNYRSTADLAEAETEFKCQFLYSIAEKSAVKFANNIGARYAQGDLAAGSSLSVIPFAGLVDTDNTIPLTALSDNAGATAASKITNAYTALGWRTNWNAAMETAANQLKATSSDRQKFVIFFTDGLPDMGDDASSAANLSGALAQAQGLYDGSSLNKMYGVFLRTKASNLENFNRLVNAMNLNDPNNTGGNGYIFPITHTTTVEQTAAALDNVYNEILDYLEKWSKSTEIIAIEDTISQYYTIDRDSLTGTEGSDWKIETTEDGREKITFYRSINGFSKIDEITNQVPLVLKEQYRRTTAHYPTNQGEAACLYKDIEGNDVKVGTATPYLPIETAPEVIKEVLSLNDTEAAAGDMVTVGDIIYYQIQYENNTNKTGTVTITDKIPAGTKFVAANEDGKEKDGVVTWEIKDVEPGAKGKVALKVKVTDKAKENIVNVAKVKIGDNEKDTNEVKNPVEPLSAPADEKKAENGGSGEKETGNGADNKENGGNGANTGDDFPLWLWAAMAAAALGGLGYCLFNNRRKKALGFDNFSSKEK